MIENLTKAYQYLIYYGGFLKSPLLLLCRLYFGAMFMAAGWGKLNNIHDFARMLIEHHFPAPYFFAYLAAATEFFGGICLFLGFASRLAAIPLAITMLTAYATVHSEAFKVFLTNPSVFVGESPFNYLLTSLLVLAFGPGRFSIDFMLERWLFNKAEGVPKHQHHP